MKRLAWSWIVLVACAAQAAAQRGGPATLAGLELGADKTDIERLSVRLNEPFSPSRFEYTATVDASYTAFLFITPRVSGAGRTLRIGGADVVPGEPHKVPLSLGENTFGIALDSGGAASYRLTVTRKDFSREYWSEPIGRGMWRIQDFGGYAGNEDMYLVEGSRRALLFDTGMGKGDLAAYVGTLTKLPVDVAVTHGHRDHFGQLDRFPEATVYLAAEDAARLPPEWITPRVRWVRGGDVIDIGGGRKFEVVPVPGHSLGSVMYVDFANRIAVTGDAVSSGSMVYMFGAACTALDQYRDGLKQVERRLASLDGLTLLVGHHYQEKTPLKGAAGKQLIIDMRTAADLVIAGRLEGRPVRTGREGSYTELRQAQFGLAGLWYNRDNLVTDPAALGFLNVETAPGTPVATRPGFSSSVTRYAASVPAAVASVSVSPTAYWSNHRDLRVNGKPVASGSPARVELGEGTNTIDVVVTSEKGSVRTYTVVITRGASHLVPGLAGTDWRPR